MMLTIIGCGNSNRMDDGLGSYVVQSLYSFVQEHGFDNIRVLDSGTAGIEVMFQAKGSDALIVIDANLSNSAPGTIYEVPGEELESLHDPGYNLHDFRWNNALYAGRKIFGDDFPCNISVFLIEAESIDLGIGLSSAVEESAKRVIEIIEQRITTYAEQSLCSN